MKHGFLRALLAAAIAFAGAASGNAADGVETLERRLVQARSGALPDVDYINPWELPARQRREFQAPVLFGWVSGSEGYVISPDRKRVHVGGDLDGHEILQIRDEGVILQVGDYAVLVR